MALEIVLDKPHSELKIWSLLSNLKGKNKRDLLEASGVVLVGDAYVVVFDDMHGIARIPRLPDDEFGEGEVIGSQKQQEGYEAITCDTRRGVLYAIVENVPDEDGRYRPWVQELTLDLVKSGDAVSLPIHLPLDNVDPNKGLEGAAIVHKDDDTFLFGLCEGRGCNSDDSRKAHGSGMIQVFQKAGDAWQYTGPLLLPTEADFRDFSDIAIRNSQVAVVSQKSSKLWVGELVSNKGTWELLHGSTYIFPKKKDKIIYCNVEGVDWVTDNQLVVVSDKASKGRCKDKEMMIHLFDLPTE